LGDLRVAVKITFGKSVSREALPTRTPNSPAAGPARRDFDKREFWRMIFSSCDIRSHQDISTISNHVSYFNRKVMENSTCKQGGFLSIRLVLARWFP